MRCTIIEPPKDSRNAARIPTLVFDAGMGNWSVFFQPLAKELAGITRICLIDRTGYTDGTSGKIRCDALTVARQLRITLETNGIQGPLILAGHSLGGLHVRMYRELFPEQTAGMILIDAAHPDLFKAMPEVRENVARQARFASRLVFPAKLGLLRLATKKIPSFGLPAEQLCSYYKVVTGAAYYNTYRCELQELPRSLDQCSGLAGLGETPLLVIGSTQGLNAPAGATAAGTSGKNRDWLRLQRDLCRISENAQFTESRSDHFPHLSNLPVTASAIKNFCAGFS